MALHKPALVRLSWNGGRSAFAPFEDRFSRGEPKVALRFLLAMTFVAAGNQQRSHLPLEEFKLIERLDRGRSTPASRQQRRRQLENKPAISRAATVAVSVLTSSEARSRCKNATVHSVGCRDMIFPNRGRDKRQDGSREDNHTGGQSADNETIPNFAGVPNSHRR